MGFLKNPKAFLMVLKTVIDKTDHRFILFSSGYQPLDSAIQSVASSVVESSECQASALHCDSTILFSSRLFCFSGSIPYSWLFPKCAVAIHHAGSGSTAAALFAGVPQIACPFLLDQFYWAERLHWLGVAPEPLRRQHLIPDTDNASSIENAADVLIGAIKTALAPEIKAQATRIADKLSSEDGIGEALRILKERVLPRTSSKVITNSCLSDRSLGVAKLAGNGAPPPRPARDHRGHVDAGGGVREARRGGGGVPGRVRASRRRTEPVISIHQVQPGVGEGEAGDGMPPPCVWQRNILMGGKCQLPEFSGVINYDAAGNVVVPGRPRAMPAALGWG
uniref:Erythromycin biosynthesis protein CIII-like C-terminal domain-containing protein n=1 Tax=Oryza brachyantha TaxID=4533 RepID=J3LAU7_ORYBR